MFFRWTWESSPSWRWSGLRDDLPETWGKSLRERTTWTTAETACSGSRGGTGRETEWVTQMSGQSKAIGRRQEDGSGCVKNSRKPGKEMCDRMMEGWMRDKSLFISLWAASGHSHLYQRKLHLHPSFLLASELPGNHGNTDGKTLNTRILVEGFLDFLEWILLVYSHLEVSFHFLNLFIWWWQMHINQHKFTEEGSSHGFTSLK